MERIGDKIQQTLMPVPAQKEAPPFARRGSRFPWETAAIVTGPIYHRRHAQPGDVTDRPRARRYEGRASTLSSPPPQSCSDADLSR